MINSDENPDSFLKNKYGEFVVIKSGAKIGSDVVINPHCFIESNVVIGNGVIIESGVTFSKNVTVGDDVHIGSNVVFSGLDFTTKIDKSKSLKIEIQKGSRIGPNSTILPGVIIGENSLIGPGTTVRKSIPTNAIVEGNPAKIIGYVNTSYPKASECNYSLADDHTHFSKVAGVTLSKIRNIEDMRGNLSVFDLENDLSFVPRRFFLVHDVPSRELRGQHSHIDCHQFLVAVKGSLRVLVDDGINKEIFSLNQNYFGLHVPPKIWAVQDNFSSDAVLLVLASHHYDEEDYVRDYDKFLKTICRKSEKEN